jgi:Na+-transporting methylmalonyl-CoA/oxaloacetate decarboxylase gamma subunit
MRRVLAVLALVVLVASCSGGGGTAETATAPSPTSAPATTQAATNGEIDAKFDVGAVTYLLATPSGWTGPPAYEAVVSDYIARYVDRFSPGVLKEVESPHYMEAAVPDRIAQELEKVIAAP